VAAARFRMLRHRLDGSLTWRLLATNNRDLARAPIAFPDADSCRADVDWLQHNVTQLRIAIVRAGPTSWSWRILAGEVVVAVSSRDYQCRIQADQAATIALDLIPVVELVDLEPRR